VAVVKLRGPSLGSVKSLAVLGKAHHAEFIDFLNVNSCEEGGLLVRMEKLAVAFVCATGAVFRGLL
jgi:hypothetical protein